MVVPQQPTPISQGWGSTPPINIPVNPIPDKMQNKIRITSITVPNPAPEREEACGLHPWLYIEEGIKLLELAQQAHQLFETQPPKEKRKLLDFVLSNCQWKGVKLETEYRQPFDLIAVAALSDRQDCAGLGDKRSNFDEWRRGGDSNSRHPFRCARFRGGCDRPLCHLSESISLPRAHRGTIGALR
jgi:hypothetical protein